MSIASGANSRRRGGSGHGCPYGDGTRACLSSRQPQDRLRVRRPKLRGHRQPPVQPRRSRWPRSALPATGRTPHRARPERAGVYRSGFVAPPSRAGTASGRLDQVRSCARLSNRRQMIGTTIESGWVRNSPAPVIQATMLSIRFNEGMTMRNAAGVVRTLPVLHSGEDENPPMVGTFGSARRCANCR